MRCSKKIQKHVDPTAKVMTDEFAGYTQTEKVQL